MPIYEYICPACERPFEKRVSFADADEPQACPACGHPRAVKQISLFAAVATGGPSSSPGSGDGCLPSG